MNASGNYANFESGNTDIMGMIKSIENMAWIAPRGGVGIDTDAVLQNIHENKCLSESEKIINKHSN